MSNNGAPDSWESQVDVISEQGAKDSDDVSAKFSTLNVNAVEFVPSFCKSSPADDAESPTTPQKSESDSTNSTGSPVLNGKSDVLSFLHAFKLGLFHLTLIIHCNNRPNYYLDRYELKIKRVLKRNIRSMTIFFL